LRKPARHISRTNPHISHSQRHISHSHRHISHSHRHISDTQPHISRLFAALNTPIGTFHARDRIFQLYDDCFTNLFIIDGNPKSVFRLCRELALVPNMGNDKSQRFAVKKHEKYKIFRRILQELFNALRQILFHRAYFNAEARTQ
jgi:hypothetical protein